MSSFPNILSYFSNSDNETKKSGHQFHELTVNKPTTTRIHETNGEYHLRVREPHVPRGQCPGVAHPPQDPLRQTVVTARDRRGSQVAHQFWLVTTGLCERLHFNGA